MEWLAQHAAVLGVGLVLCGVIVRVERRLTTLEVNVKWIKRALERNGFTDNGAGSP